MMYLLTPEVHAQIVDALSVAYPTDRSKLPDHVAAIALLKSMQPASPTRFEYRWTNPGNQECQPDSMIEWKPVEPSWNQSNEQKCTELAAYRCSGKVVYELRYLYTPTNNAGAVR